MGTDKPQRDDRQDEAAPPPADAAVPAPVPATPPPAGAAPAAGPPASAPARRPARRFTGWRKWALRAALAVGTPLLGLLLLEGGLRLLGYGYPTSFFVKLDGRDAYTGNPCFGWRYAPRPIAAHPQPLLLPARKAPGTYRIFVLGESAAMGTPDSSYGLARMLEAMLRLKYPQAHFEVINTATTAINSHVILPIARDCAGHQPDLLVVYMGNNELVGAFGPCTVFEGFSPHLAAIRGTILLRSTRVGQLLQSWGQRSRGQPADQRWRGMEMFLEHSLAADDPRATAAHAHFRANLEDICAAARGAGAKAVVCTMAVNLCDCPPFGSLHRPDLTAAEQARWQALVQEGAALEGASQTADAAAQYRAALQIDDRYAELHYRLARCLGALQQYDAAREHYRRARDLDALPFRADSAINQAIRAVAGGRERDGLHLVDAERAFEQASTNPAHAPGREWFYEHVHFKFQGTYVLARAVFQKIADLLPAEVRQGAAPAEAPTNEQCAAALAYTAADRYRLAQSMGEMVARPPFTGQLDHAQLRALWAQRLATLQTEGLADTHADATYEAALRQWPEDWRLRWNYANLLGARGDPAGAAAQLRKVLEALPVNAAAEAALASALLRQGQGAEARACYAQLVARHPDHAELRKGLADCLAALGQGDAAVAEYREALRLRPDYADAHTNLAAVLTQRGDVDAAVAQLREALQSADDPAAHLALGNLLGKQGRMAEAVIHYRQAAAGDPRNASVHNNLGAALAAQGQLDEAVAHFLEALRLNPKHDKAHLSLGEALEQQGKPQWALEHYRQAVALRPDWPAALTHLARLLASAKDPALRHGAEAVRLATRACQLTGEREPTAVDALAMACAETGQFAEAQRLAQLAATLATGNPALAEQIRRRAQLYAAHQPYRQE